MARQRPDVVFLAAAKVGGILANDTYPADFLYDNLMIAANMIEAAHCDRRREAAVPRLVLHLSARCAAADRRGALLTGPLEPTNEWYAIAKIAGIKLCQAYRRQYGCDFIAAMPTNLYGPSDNFDLETSHVLPALMRKAHEAKSAATPDDGRSGAPARRGASSCTSTISPTPASILMKTLRRRRAAQRRLRRGHHHRRTGRADCRAWSGFKGELVFDTSQAGRHAAQAARRLQADGARLEARHLVRIRSRRLLRMVPEERNLDPRLSGVLPAARAIPGKVCSGFPSGIAT